MNLKDFFYCFFSLVNHTVLQQVVYLQAENKILKAHLKDRLILSRIEKMILALAAKPLGSNGLKQISTVFSVNTLLRW